MASIHGLVIGRRATPHPSYRRYIAILDILGMRSWLEQETARNIAERIDEALVACETSSSGITGDGISYGPVIGVTHFSDSLMAWSPDDSWASLAIMSHSVQMIVAVALLKGVPLRGAIAVGEVVCKPEKLRFVGQPIAEAFIWSEKKRPYRSVGVDLTPETIINLRQRLVEDPLPECWANSISGISPSVLTGEHSSSLQFIWFSDCLFINHWSHGIFTSGNPREMFLKRKLEIPIAQQADVDEKIRQMITFYEETRRSVSNNIAVMGINGFREHEYGYMQQLEYIRLSELRKAREG